VNKLVTKEEDMKKTKLIASLLLVLGFSFLLFGFPFNKNTSQDEINRINLQIQAQGFLLIFFLRKGNTGWALFGRSMQNRKKSLR